MLPICVVASAVNPIIAFIGVRISWDILFRNAVFALFACSAAASAFLRFLSRSISCSFSSVISRFATRTVLSFPVLSYPCGTMIIVSHLPSTVWAVKLNVSRSSRRCVTVLILINSRYFSWNGSVITCCISSSRRALERISPFWSGFIFSESFMISISSVFKFTREIEEYAWPSALITRSLFWSWRILLFSVLFLLTQ